MSEDKTDETGTVVQLTKWGASDTFAAKNRPPADAIASNAALAEDEYQNFYVGGDNDKGVIAPPHSLRSLEAKVLENNALLPCIDAMVNNIDGTGHTFESEDQQQSEDAGDDTTIKELEGFFKEPWPGKSWVDIRKELRRDRESIGMAYLEIIRNPAGDIVMLRPVDAKLMRIVKLDTAVAVEKKLIRGGKEVKVKVLERQRRFVQMLNGLNLFYFKDFGVERDLNKRTGEWAQDGKRLPAVDRATEIAFFGTIPDVNTPYHLPRWITQLPSVLGSRQAEEYNMGFFERGGVPPVLLILQGGTLGPETRKAFEQKTQGFANTKQAIGVVEVDPTQGNLNKDTPPAKVQVERFGAERQQDAMFETYDEKCEMRVRKSFRLPPIFVGQSGDYNFATAYASYTVAEAQVFKPERDAFDNWVNMMLLPAMGYHGYRMVSNPVKIEDATLKLQAITMAQTTAVVSDDDLLTELNEVTGTSLKPDDQLKVEKKHVQMGNNPDGSAPAPELGNNGRPDASQPLPRPAALPRPGASPTGLGVKTPTAQTAVVTGGLPKSPSAAPPRAALGKEELRKFNEAHNPAGSPKGGQFASKNGTGGSDDHESSAGAKAGSVQDAGGVSGGAGGVAASGRTADATPLTGLPTHVKVPGLGTIEAGPFLKARQAAVDYMAEAGLPYSPPTEYAKVDPERAKRIADAFDAMPHAPDDPAVKAAYAAMIDEVVAQWKAVEKTGLDIDWIDYAKDGDPYAASPRLATEDVRKNNHLWVFPTDAGFGSDAGFDAKDNPLLADTGVVIKGHKLRANDLFRIVHDYFGHIKEGFGFRADGEENAWRSHAAMFSPLARKAMTTETRGQNSWVNYGPFGESNRTASGAATHFADQKIGLLPDWAITEGSGQEKMSKGDIAVAVQDTLIALRKRDYGKLAESVAAYTTWDPDTQHEFKKACAIAQFVDPSHDIDGLAELTGCTIATIAANAALN